jgi:metal-sulfur cluster biosynthetic enzyme
MNDGRTELRDRMLRDAIIEVLRDGFDPSGEGNPISLVDAGLIRDVAVHGQSVRVELLVATTWSPVVDALVTEVERRVQTLPEVARTDVCVISGECPAATSRSLRDNPAHERGAQHEA